MIEDREVASLIIPLEDEYLFRHKMDTTVVLYDIEPILNALRSKYAPS